MDVMSFYTNIPQDEGIQTVCEAYDTFYKVTRLLAQALRLILQENSSQFAVKITYKLHMEPLTTWALKWWSHLPIRYLRAKSKQKSLAKAHSNLSFGNDMSTTSGDTNREVLTQFNDQASNDRPTFKFTASISETETTFLDTSVYKGQRFIYESVLDKRTTTSPLKNVSTHISPRITHLGPDVRKRVSANCGLNVDHGF